MYTAMAMVALTAGMTSGKLTPNPVWLEDYGAAQTRVTEAHKPMIVFVANGKAGWETVLRDGTLSPIATKLLAENFVCVYANTNTSAGRNLADVLQVGNKGLVISDKSGSTQAYSLAGDLTGNELVRALETYADADPKDVKKTETIVTPAAVGHVSANSTGCGSTGGCNTGRGMSKGCCFFGGMSKGCGQSSGCGHSSGCAQPTSSCGSSKFCCGFGGFKSFCGFGGGGGGGHSSGCGTGGGCK